MKGVYPHKKHTAETKAKIGAAIKRQHEAGRYPVRKAA